MRREYSNRIWKARTTILYVMIAMITLGWWFFLVGTETNHSLYRMGRLKKVNFTGTYQLSEHDVPVTLSDTGLKEIEDVPQLILTGYFDSSIPKNEEIYFYLRRINMEMYVNDVLVYCYSDKSVRPHLLKSGGNTWVCVYSPGISSTDRIRIVMKNPYRYNLKNIYHTFVERIYSGERLQLFFHMIAKKKGMVSTCFSILLLSIVLLLCSVILHLMKIQGMNKVFQCGMVMLVSSLWLLLDPSYITLIFPYSVSIDILETLCLISIPTLAIHYGKSYMITKAKGFLSFMEYALLAINVCYIILQSRGIVDAEMMQEIFRCLLFCACVFMCFAVGYEMKYNHAREAVIVFWSSEVLIACGIIAYLVYVVTRTLGAQIFWVGLTIYAMTQIVLSFLASKEHYERAQTAAQLENELMESKVAIMLSQIQPHFLYNSISSIRELCILDPKLAQDALSNFAQFLRGNMDSLTSNHPIPFLQELNHVKNYLALEQIRFEERLRIEYDLEVEEFFIPSLSIQPLVENAVRYGVSKKREGGMVRISTREDEAYYRIIIEDDGRGFDVNEPIENKNGRSHVGLLNVKKRLESQMGAAMEVHSVVGEGTKVTINIPKNT